MVSGLRGRLRAVGGPVPGALHDAYAYTASRATAVAGRRSGLGDKAYQGRGLFTPCNKPLHRPLTEAEKGRNRAHFSLCSAVERCIGHLENWKILSEDYRGPPTRVAQTLETVVQRELLRTWSTP
ncbi:hypothetical protein C9F11_43665 (plasmid) [Streptomyces sp. YIM 121038]|uniref:transposase family protein n=1 Tax=Streptomyces sp. YIM 121038 TaxID=2136401 RepID=UPI00111022B9|nr:transposase family protein [Streptomyces sp. YIM 121038]QCX82311.1 hypothetical protein C9F11_43665 [Streptomyces sp. YIM 121038]